MNEFGVDHNNPIYETVYQQLKKSIPTDSSTPTSPIPNKTGTHTIPRDIPHRHTTGFTTQVTLLNHTSYTYIHTIHITADTSNS
jgi:hypothetical protein